MLQSEGLIGNTTILSTRIALIMSVTVEGSIKVERERGRERRRERGRETVRKR